MKSVPRARPILRYHGGKWRIAPWIIGHFPPHRVYVEPFGGAASVLLRKSRSYAEVYNDLDDDLVNLFRILRSADAERLVELVRFSPFARTEFLAAYEHCTDPLEKARRLIVRSFMGFGSDGTTGKSTGFRANSNRSGSTPALDWSRYPHALAAAVERLTGVIIEHRPAIDVMRQHDSATTLHYVDPPYLPTVRGQSRPGSGLLKHTYRHELSIDDHCELLAALLDMKGMVVLSGYSSQLYEEMLLGWERIEREAMADGAQKRIEVLWCNPAAATKIQTPPPIAKRAFGLPR